MAIEDKLRDEVAALLSLRIKTIDMQRTLGELSGKVRREPDDIPSEGSWLLQQELLTARDAYIEHVDGLAEQATRISLLTKDAKLNDALGELRDLTYGDWTLPMKSLTAGPREGWPKWWADLEELRSNTQFAFVQIETATRELVTHHGATRKAAVGR
ncbi:hypothetical protein A6I91_01880 [Prescottella equi]|nr:hypothetical protein A6I91_01880 [Prescottella equi]